MKGVLGVAALAALATAVAVAGASGRASSPNDCNPKTSAWFLVTYTWKGGGTMGGCRSDRTDIKGGVTFFDPRGNVISGVITTQTGQQAFTVRSGVVEIRPTGGRPMVSLKANQEVEVTPKTVSKIAKPGQAGLVGGLNRVAAVRLVLAKMGRYNDRCKIAIPRSAGYSAKASKSRWLVTVKVAGKLKGSSTWHASGRKATALNPLAKKIAGGCR